MKFVLSLLLGVLSVKGGLAGDGESAVQEVRRELDERGHVEGFNAATGEVIGVGYASADESQIRSVNGDFDKYIELTTIARSKALMEVSKAINPIVSAGRSLESASRPDSRYRALSRVVRMRTEGCPLGCVEVARVRKVFQGRNQIAIALKWSLALEEAMVKSFLEPLEIDDEVLALWARKQDLVSMLGPWLWTDGKGGTCFLGIGVSEVWGENAAAKRTALRRAAVHAKKHLAYCFLENLTGEEVVTKGVCHKTSEDGTALAPRQSFTYEINRNAHGILPSGARQIYSSFDFKSPITGKPVCVCIFALKAVDARSEIRDKFVD